MPSTEPHPEGTNPPPFSQIFLESNFQYTLDEITAIQTFVAEGNGLLLISDHGPMPKKHDDQTIGLTAPNHQVERSLVASASVVDLAERGLAPQRLLTAAVAKGHDAPNSGGGRRRDNG